MVINAIINIVKEYIHKFLNHLKNVLTNIYVGKEIKAIKNNAHISIQNHLLVKLNIHVIIIIMIFANFKHFARQKIAIDIMQKILKHFQIKKMIKRMINLRIYIILINLKLQFLNNTQIPIIKYSIQ